MRRPWLFAVRGISVLGATGAVVVMLISPAAATHDSPGLPQPTPLPARPKSCLPMPAWAGGGAASTTQPAAGIQVHTWHGKGAGSVPMRVVAVEADLVRVDFGVITPARLGSVEDTTMFAHAPGVAVGLNGDYFDPGPPGAVPRGVEVRDGTVLYAPPGTTRVFGSDSAGAMSTGLAHLTGVVTARLGAKTLKLQVGSVNASRPVRHAIRLLTAYGAGQPRRASWYVRVHNGMAVSSSANDPGAPRGRDTLLMAPVDRPGALRRLKTGTRVKVQVAVAGSNGTTFTDAMGRGGVILRDRAVVSKCTGSYGTGWRPRSVIAWNNQQARLWFIAVNALSGGSASGPGVRGFTYAQMADVARHLGATDAVLVDGGHSTTLAVRKGHDVIRADAPGSAGQRPVADGLVLSPR